MQNKISLMVLFVFIFFITGCSIHSLKYWSNEKKRVDECRSEWVYKDLGMEQEVTVLLFSAKFNRSISSYPNFLIVLTKENDTIAFLDKDFDDEIKVGNKIKILPFQWNEAEKLIKKPAFVVQNKAKQNDLYCKVKTVYYGKICLNTFPPPCSMIPP